MADDEIGEARPSAEPLGEEAKLWTLSRIDIRSPLSPRAFQVARVELEHPVRGRVTEIGTAPGAFDAAFAALCQILRISPRLLSFDVRSEAPVEGEALNIRIDVELELGGRIYKGTSLGKDLVRCAISAWLDAASGELEGEGQGKLRGHRFEVSGIDENDDLWTFSTDDREAAEEVEAEFREDGFREIRRLGAR